MIESEAPRLNGSASFTIPREHPEQSRGTAMASSFRGFRRGAKPPVPKASLWYGTNPAPNFILILG